MTLFANQIPTSKPTHVGGITVARSFGVARPTLAYLIMIVREIVLCNSSARKR